MARRRRKEQQIVTPEVVDVDGKGAVQDFSGAPGHVLDWACTCVGFHAVA